MRLSVKILGGVECVVDAQDDYTVEQLKADIEAKLKLGRSEQKLLYKGKALQDGTFLSAYKLTDGSKINLVVKREAAVSTAVPNRQNFRVEEDQVVDVGTLEEELFKSLRKHFRNDADTTKVVTVFVNNFHKKLSSLSLDDVERISRKYQETRELQF